MVGIGISSASAGTDAVSLAKGSRSSSNSSSDDSHGFLDALNNSGSGRDTNAPKKSASDTDASDAGSAQGDAGQAQGDATQPATSGTTAAGTDSKATDALKGKGAAQSFAQSLTAIPEAAPTVPTVPDIATPAADANPAKTTAADIAQQLAAMVAGDTPGQPVADAKGNVPTVKGGKTSDTADKDADDDSKASDANAASGTITDALSLLNAGLPGTAVPAQTAASVLAAAGQLHAGTGKVVPSTDGNVGALPTDVEGDKTDAVATGMAMLTSAVAGNGSNDAATTDDDSPTQAFNVVKANTKVQALDPGAGKNAGDASLDLKSVAGDGTGTITVLDSRRFVGLADGSNSALVANSLTGNKDWAAAMQPSAALTGASVTTSASKVMNSLKIQMNPENLGTVTATMRLSGDQLSVDLKVQSAEAYRQLSNDQSAMVDSLRQQGYSVDRITVSYTSPDTSSNSQQGSQSQQQQQQPQHQSGASQGQGGEAQARKQNSGRQAGDQDDVWGTGNVGADDSIAGNAQRARAGGVYL